MNKLTMGALAILSLLTVNAYAVRSYAITENGNFMAFDHSNPSSPYFISAVTGLMPNEKLVGIDCRPANAVVHGVGSFGNLYAINRDNGNATMISFSSAMPNGGKFGVDFNPVPDRLRVTSNLGQNLRINVETGIAIIDGMLNNGSGMTPNIVASAYTNSFAGATSTMLYNIDSEMDALVVQNPPNDGTLMMVANLAADLDDRTSFDIFSSNGDNRGFIVANLPGSTSSTLHRIDLMSGALRLQGTFRGSDRVIGFTFDTREGRRS